MRKSLFAGHFRAKASEKVPESSEGHVIEPRSGRRSDVNDHTTAFTGGLFALLRVRSRRGAGTWLVAAVSARWFG
jgi:hypothetical protein